MDTPTFGTGTDLNEEQASPAAKGLGGKKKVKGLKGWKGRRGAKRQARGQSGPKKGRR